MLKTQFFVRGLANDGYTGPALALRTLLSILYATRTIRLKVLLLLVFLASHVAEIRVPWSTIDLLTEEISSLKSLFTTRSNPNTESNSDTYSSAVTSNLAPNSLAQGVQNTIEQKSTTV